MSTTSHPLISIGIPTHNRAGTYLKGAIECTLNQTYPNIEIIVADNCSTDHTELVVKSHEDPRVRYFGHKENIGANNNFNFCVNAAQGEFFLLLHDDDRIDPDFIEVCVNALSGNTNTGLIRTGTRLIDASDKVLFERPNPVKGLSAAEFFLAWFNNQTTFYFCSTLYNTAKLKAIGGFYTKHNLFQDVAAAAQILTNSNRIDIEDVKASFRMHEESVGSSARTTAWCEDSLELVDTICGLFPDHADILRRKGMPFFCRMNYTYAATLPSPVLRLWTYLKVARMFNYADSPLDYFVMDDIRPRLRSTWKKIKGLIVNISNRSRGCR
jgi:glycosyltransferase involved in cell wall biosynthesis